MPSFSSPGCMRAMIDRRKFLVVLLGLLATPGLALAKDGDSGGGGNSGSGGGGGGNSGPGGGGNSGPGGGGNSGPGGGNDNDDNDDDDDRDDDQDDARRARERGEADSLRKILGMAKKKYGGRVVDVRLRRQSGKLFYDIKMVGKDGALRRLKLDAKTGVAMTGAGG